MPYLAALALSSTSSLRDWALYVQITDEGWLDDENIIPQLFWNNKFSLQELIIDGKLPELGEIFEQQQQLNSTHIDASLICITRLILSYSYIEKDPMPLLEKIPTLRHLHLSSRAYMGNEMVCSAMGFPQLTRLELGELPKLKNWRVEEGSMPILSLLAIYLCEKLEELPKGLVFLNSLQNLVLNQGSEFYNKIRAANGEEGPDFYKVAHVPNVRFIT